MKSFILVSLSLGLAVILALFLIRPAEAGLSTPGGSPEDNFLQYCAGCHGVNMERFAGKTYDAGSSAEMLKQTIKYGSSELGMPAFEKAFSEQELSELTSYLLNELNKGQEQAEVKQFPGTIKSMHESFRVETVLTGLDVPWSLLFLPDGDMLLAERSGQLFRFRDNKLAAIIEGVPPVFAKGQGGLFDLVLHPSYEENGWIYISYAKISPSNENEGNTAVIRARIQNDTLTDLTEIFSAKPYSSKNYHFGGRMAFDREGCLYITVGERGTRENAQQLNNFSGKVHRINDDGTIPRDNPFAKDFSSVSSIYSYGHRNQQGIVIDTATGAIYTNEHGPKGGDELNRIEPGRNYGWPVITYGINYDGTIITELTEKAGMEQPLYQWTPSIAPSSLMLSHSSLFPGWEGDFFSGSLSFRYLERTRMENGKMSESEKLLEGIGRVRYVTTGPDGYIYFTVEKPGVVYRLVPAE